MNKKISFPIAIIIILVCAVLVAGLAIWCYLWVPTAEIPEFKTAEKTPPAVDTANWRTYRNEEYGFEVKYPYLICKEFPESERQIYSRGEEKFLIIGDCISGRVEVGERVIQIYVGPADLLEKENKRYLTFLGPSLGGGIEISKISSIKQGIEEVRRLIQNNSERITNVKEEQILFNKIPATKIFYDEDVIYRTTITGQSAYEPHHNTHIFINKGHNLKIFFFLTTFGLEFEFGSETQTSLINQVLSTFRFLE